MTLIVKFFPLLLVSGLGGMALLNKQQLKNSEEVEVSEMSKGFIDVEKSWGDIKSNNNNRKMSWWKRGENGFTRSEEGREEIHKDLFIFDLCNPWIEFPKSQEKQNQDNSDGYGYLWKDICNIVRDEFSDVGWLKFVTSVMTNRQLVNVNKCCQEDKKDSFNCGENWENGKWLSKCLELEKEKNKVNDQKKKICTSIWNNKNDQQDLVSKNLEVSNCVDEDFVKKISQKIKMSRNGFEGNTGNNYLCQQHNDYKNKGENGKINEECKKKLRERIKSLVQDSRENPSLEGNNKDECKGFYDGIKGLKWNVKMDE